MGYIAAQPVLTEQDLDELVVNMDYDLLIRSHGPIDEASAEVVSAERRSRMRQRVQVAQFSSRVLLHFLKGDMDATETSLLALHSALQREGHAAVSSYLQYDPSFQTPMQLLIWKVYEDTVALFVQVYRFQSSSKDDAPEVTDRSLIFSRLKSLMINFQSLRDGVALPMLAATKQDSVAIDLADVSLRVLFSPDWLKTVSFMCTTICSWIPLMLQFILQEVNPLSSVMENGSISIYPQLCDQLTSKGKNVSNVNVNRGDWNWADVVAELEGQSTSQEDFSVGETLLVVIEMFLQIFGELEYLSCICCSDCYNNHTIMELLGEIRSVLPVAPAGQIDGGLLTDSATANLEEYFLSMETHLGVFEPPGKSDLDVDVDSGYRQYLKLALDSILSSHSLSFARLQQVIDSKISSIFEIR